MRRTRFTIKRAKTLHQKAWAVFSKWIRNRDKKCFTCNGNAENAGHFWHGVLDFDEENIHGQCVRCNKWLHGNLAVYSTNLLALLGKKRFDALTIRHYRAMGGEKRTEQEYNDIIAKYTL